MVNRNSARNDMSRIKLFQLLALIGVVGFVIDFAWIVPKAKALFEQSAFLVEDGLPEESANYRDEARQLTNFIIPIALLATAFIAPLNVYLISRGLKKYAK